MNSIAIKALLIILALAGTVVMGYLWYSKVFSVESPFCELGESFSCDLVNQSKYSEIFGIPISALGMFYFLGILTALIGKYSADTLKKILFFSIVFLGPSLYLTAIEIFVLETVCILCEISKVIIIGIIVVSWFALKPKKLSNQALISALILAAVLAGFNYLIHAGTGPGDKYNEFAECLDEKGFIMYGSMTCASCARQRALFGDAFQFIEEIECDPRNPNPETERCIKKEIEKTPTWIQEDAEGNELYRFEPGMQSLEKLSEVSGCLLEKVEKNNNE